MADEATPPRPDARSRWAGAAGLVRPFAVVLAVFSVGYSAVRVTNFLGWDEWLIRDLMSRWIVAAPYANRPFGFVWHLPGGLLTPHGFGGFYLAHGAYLVFTALLTMAIVCRCWPRPSWLASFAGVFAAVWAPLDLARLSPVQMSLNSGAALGITAAALLLLLAARPASVTLAALATAAAYLTVRSYEATLPLLWCAPLLPLAARTGLPRRVLAVWLAGLTLATAQAALPLLLRDPSAVAYQMVALHLDAHPGRVLARLGGQYWAHLQPLGRIAWPELAHAEVAVAVTLLIGGSMLAVRRAEALDAPDRGILLRALVAGLLAAGLGYAVYVLSPTAGGVDRTQFLAAPGIAVALAAAIGLLASLVPAGARSWLVLALAAWVVAVGTARTLALQRIWDTRSRFADQRDMLAQLVEQAPELRPNTLVLLLDRRGAWPSVFPFRHAVEYLYGREATGLVWRTRDFLYDTTYGADGVRTRPLPSIEKAWGSLPTHHRFDEIIAFRLTSDGRLLLCDRWPPQFSPLPPWSRYAPHGRILPPGKPRPERGVLAAPAG